MSASRQRGRQVKGETQQAKTLKAFYWVIGIIAVVGTIAVVAYTLRGEPAVSDTSLDTPPMLNVTPMDPEFSIPEPGEPLPSGKTSDGFYYKGEQDAPVTVVEYSDFQCPACAFHDQTTVAKLVNDYVVTGYVRLVYHDFPLNIHPNAPKASEAALCAGDQEKFWDMHDVLYQQQDTWSKDPNPSASYFPSFADQLELNRDTFVSCLNSGTYTQFVANAYQASVQAGINQTPTFVVNGKRVDAGYLFAEIDAVLAAQGQE